MKAALLVESLTGNTWKAAEMIAANLQQEGWTITGLNPMKQPDHHAIQAADLIVVGTWVHGAFIVGQAPWGIGNIDALPAIAGKRAATFSDTTSVIDICNAATVSERTIYAVANAPTRRAANSSVCAPNFER